MKYFESKPSPRLVQNIKCFWSIRSDVGAGGPEPVLPDGCPEIVFNLSDRFRRIYSDGSFETQPSAIVSGQLRSGISIMSTGHVDLFGVRFHPSGAFSVLGMPLRELTDRIEALDSVIGREARQLEEMIFSARDFHDRIHLFETFCVESVNGLSAGDGLAGRLVQTIVDHRGRISVSDLRSISGFGERKLERTFQRFVGLSPKTFARIVRFQSVVRRIETVESADLLDTALDFGYYDQSHMIREFREFSGKSPVAYFEEKHRISELFTTSVPASDSYNTLEGPQSYNSIG
jgi:AraC-like DNA-binding protein